MEKRKCRFRRTEVDCTHPIIFRSGEDSTEQLCALCLKGQLIESVELLTSAVIERKVDEMEGVF